MDFTNMFRWLLLAVAAILISGEGDFYDILGVKKDANARDIRRAFKQAALKYHPDKNDEPDAHTKFLSINRAYEVLKDDEKRRKYDLHGEAGLDENGHGGRGGQYQSWNYYQQDFGLYDDDPEIVTLSASDFDLLVSSSNDTWFINFYSPGCPPCHKLAPTWREVARDIDGIVRVGAVNCQEDRQLCHEQGINSYPSLLLFPRSGGRYQGDRSRDALVNYVMRQVPLSFARLETEEFFESAGKPWLVHFCASSQETDCLSDMTLLRLTGMLRNLMDIGLVDCDQQPSLCKKHNADSGHTLYFPSKSTKTNTEPVELPATLDARELSSHAITLLPKARVFTEKSFDVVRNRIQVEPVLLLFGVSKNAAEDNELRKLSLLLPDMEVGIVDCAQLTSACADYHVTSETTLLLKAKGYEIFYGKRQALDIAAFARESVLSSVRALGPEDFPQPVAEGSSPFFVDFFAPWCPPCKRLLPQFRKAATGVPAVSFGTVDCVVHGQLCRNYNVHSYPTTILFNSSVPHQYSGGHSSNEIIEFAEDVLRPSVIDLTPESFAVLVEKRSTDTTVLVDFYSPHCGPCIQLAPTWNKLAKLIGSPQMPVAKIDCAKYKSFCQAENLRGYPTMRAYPQGHAGKSRYEDFQGWRNLQSIRSWSLSFLPRVSENLNANSFVRSVQNRHDRPYLVLFSAGHWCGPCQSFLPEFESLARKMEEERYIMGFGVVNCDQTRQVCADCQIHQYPMMKVYEGDERHAAGGFVIGSQNADEIMNIILHNIQSLRRKPKKKKKNTATKRDEL